MDGWMDHGTTRIRVYTSYMIYARIRLHIHVISMNACQLDKQFVWHTDWQIDRLTIPSLASSSIFATGKLGFKLLGFKVSANTDPRLPFGTVSMAADAAAAASFFFLLSWSFWMRSARDCSLPNEVEDPPGSIYIYMKGCQTSKQLNVSFVVYNSHFWYNVV